MDTECDDNVEKRLQAKSTVILDNNDLAIDPEIVSAAYYGLYTSMPSVIAKSISNQQRLREGYDSVSLGYAEIEFLEFKKQFTKIYNYGFHPQNNGIFIDIGCGVGNCVFAAALLHNFHSCIGIEILSDLYCVCNNIKDNLWSKQVRCLSKIKLEIEIEFKLGDALVIDWSYGNIIFINATCFSEDMMLKLSTCADNLAVGSIVISVTKFIPSLLFDIVEISEMHLSWGKASLYIQVRNSKVTNISHREFIQKLLDNEIM